MLQHHPLQRTASRLVFAAVSMLLVSLSSSLLDQRALQGQETTTQNPNKEAFELMKSFQHGVNLGNFLEVPRGQDWGDNSMQEIDYKRIAEQGFDHVRIPAGWHDYTGSGPEYLIEESFFQKVEKQLDWAEQFDLAAVVNIHHFSQFVESPDEQQAKLVQIWKQIATRFKDRPTTVAFELFNEPHGNASNEVMNKAYAEVVNAIRSIDQKHLIIVGPSEWNGVRGLEGFEVPDDERLAVTVHSYDPFLFTHQGASWTDGMQNVRNVAFPGPGKTKLPIADGTPDWIVNQINSYNEAVESQTAEAPAFESILAQAAAWGKEHNRPIYVGEFGAVATANAEARAAFYGDFRKTAEELNLGWSIWDWKAGFRYWNRDTNSPEPGLQEALFGSDN